MKSMRYTLLGLALALAGTATAWAGDVNMASGSVHFSTPSNWIGIMQIDGDPEVRVFQVPDPSPSASSTLARVSVTVKQVGSLQDFNDYVGSAIAKARTLKDYQPGIHASNDQNTFIYTASESGTPYTYTERYWFRGGHAIQLRCVRPSASEAGQSWAASFDKGCSAVAANLNL